MQNIYGHASSSVSATYSNITSCIKEELESKLPKGFLRSTTVSSEIAYKQIKRALGPNNEFNKRKAPYMVIRPQYNMPSDDMFLYDTLLTKNVDNIENSGIDAKTLMPIMADHDKSTQLMYKLNRDQITFNITIALQTQLQQLDIYKYLRNTLVWERSYGKNTSLEAQLPRELIRYLGKMNGIDINTQSQLVNVPIMINYINRRSMYPVTYKMRTSTTIDEFFMYYQTMIIYTISELDIDEGSKKNMSDDVYLINFKVTADFNLPGIFFIVGEKPRPKEITFDIRSFNSDGTCDLIPLYTINNLYGEYISSVDGFSLMLNSIFQTEADQKTKNDILNISCFFSENQLKVIKRETLLNNPSNNVLLRFTLFKDSQVLIEQTDWKIDWNTMNITIFLADNNATYRILIYCNNIILNEKIIEIVDSENSEKSHI